MRSSQLVHDLAHVHVTGDRPGTNLRRERAVAGALSDHDVVDVVDVIDVIDIEPQG